MRPCLSCLKNSLVGFSPASSHARTISGAPMSTAACPAMSKQHRTSLDVGVLPLLKNLCHTTGFSSSCPVRDRSSLNNFTTAKPPIRMRKRKFRRVTVLQPCHMRFSTFRNSCATSPQHNQTQQYSCQVEYHVNLHLNFIRDGSCVDVPYQTIEPPQKHQPTENENCRSARSDLVRVYFANFIQIAVSIQWVDRNVCCRGPKLNNLFGRRLSTSMWRRTFRRSTTTRSQRLSRRWRKRLQSLRKYCHRHGMHVCSVVRNCQSVLCCERLLT